MSQNPHFNGPFFGDQGIPGIQIIKKNLSVQQQIPLRVSAAFRAMESLHGMRFVPSNSFGGSGEFRNFTQKEAALWNASLDTLRLYVSGENDFRDVSTRELNDEQDDDTLSMSC